MSATALMGRPVASRKKNLDRERMELRADPEWINNVAEYADAWGTGISALVRMAVNKWMMDNPVPPEVKRSPRKKNDAEK